MRRTIASIWLGSLLASSALAQSDHNNIDSGRPLRFDDAYSIAFRERALEFGLSLDSFRRTAARYGFRAEYKVGFAKNQDIGVTFDPTYGGSSRRFDAGNVELAYFNSLKREIGNSPALAYRVEVGLPTGRDSRGVDVKLRGIATRALGQYDRIHLNVDANVLSNPTADERNLALGVIIGYTSPLGYPKKFDQTLVAEFGVQQSRFRDQGYTGTVGIGIRKQMSPRTVFDMGIESDVFATRGASQSPVRLTVGYSVGF